MQRKFEKDAGIPLQYIGAATLIVWNKLSKEIQDEIYDLALNGQIGGLPPTTSLKEQLMIHIHGSDRNWNATRP
jgi:hypothetical protein